MSEGKLVGSGTFGVNPNSELAADLWRNSEDSMGTIIFTERMAREGGIRTVDEARKLAKNNRRRMECLHVFEIMAGSGLTVSQAVGSREEAMLESGVSMYDVVKVFRSARGQIVRVETDDRILEAGVDYIIEGEPPIKADPDLATTIYM